MSGAFDAFILEQRKDLPWGQWYTFQGCFRPIVPSCNSLYRTKANVVPTKWKSDVLSMDTCRIFLPLRIWALPLWTRPHRAHLSRDCAEKPKTCADWMKMPWFDACWRAGVILAHSVYCSPSWCLCIQIPHNTVIWIPFHLLLTFDITDINEELRLSTQSGFFSLNLPAAQKCDLQRPCQWRSSISERSEYLVLPYAWPRFWRGRTSSCIGSG